MLPHPTTSAPALRVMTSRGEAMAFNCLLGGFAQVFAIVLACAQLPIKNNLYASGQAQLPTKNDALRRVGGHLG